MDILKVVGSVCRAGQIFLPESFFYFYKSPTRPCIEYGWHIWFCAPTIYHEILDQIQRIACNDIAPGLLSFPTLCDINSTELYRFISEKMLMERFSEYGMFYHIR